MQTSGGAASSGALELKVIRAAEKPATAPTVLVSDKWVPDAVKQFSPRSRLGEYVKACARLLPRAMALELIDRLASTVVIESSLALKHFSGGLHPETGEFDEQHAVLIHGYGVVSRRFVTNVAATKIAAWMGGVAASSIATFKYHGIGQSSAPAESQTNTALGGELTTQYVVDNTRATGDQTNPGFSNMYQTVGTNTNDLGGGVGIVEHGIFDMPGTGAGNLLDRSTFSVVNLALNDSLQTTYQFTITAGG